MRIAVVSDIHGNRTAFEAVLNDLRETSPDLILHGGDVADGGSSPIEIVDQIRALGWQGVVGNTDEMLYRPESLAEFAARRPPQLQPMFAMIEEMAAFTRDALGEDRLAWFSKLPKSQVHHPVALVHATPDSPWRSIMQDNPELEETYPTLNQPIVVYGHIHKPYIRKLNKFTIANSGSVGLPHDGDHRASYLLIDGSVPKIRRVEYDLDNELKALSTSGEPHWTWIARILQSASPQMP